MEETLVLAIGAALGIERLTELILNIIFTLVTDLQQRWEEKLSGGVKLLLTFLFNGGLYAAFIRLDFVTPIFESYGAVIDPWQGTVLSCLLVAGGSQLIHEFFSFRNIGNGA